MKRAFHLVLLFAGACAAPALPAPTPRASDPPALPPSALAGAVHALEMLDAHHSPAALVHVRALEASALVGHATPAGLVRVFLHVTVYAESSASARAAFDELHEALESSARAPAELAPVSGARARAALEASSWERIGGEELLSYSDAIRVELTPAPATVALGKNELRAAENVEIEEYVRGLAAREGLTELDLSLRASAALPGVSEARCHVRDAPASSAHTRAEIGAFLSALESGSPAARLTELRIERSQNVPDPNAAAVWTFEAFLVVRVPGE